MTTLLEVDRLDTFYGKSHVLRDLSFGVPRGRITTLLGRNGMGKTTTLRSIMGLTPPRSGTIRFDGRDITGQPSYRVARLGLGYVPEGRQLFPHLDVGANLQFAAIGVEYARISDELRAICRESEPFSRVASGPAWAPLPAFALGLCRPSRAARACPGGHPGAGESFLVPARDKE